MTAEPCVAQEQPSASEELRKLKERLSKRLEQSLAQLSSPVKRPRLPSTSTCALPLLEYASGATPGRLVCACCTPKVPTLSRCGLSSQHGTRPNVAWHVARQVHAAVADSLTGTALELQTHAAR
jgi:hypothetical protein